MIIRDNIFRTGPEAAAAVHFEARGSDILMDGSTFRGSTGKILLDESTQVTLGTNIGAQVERPAEGLRFGNP